MDCQRASEILSAVRDGAVVEPGLVAQARAHAGSCDACRAMETVADRIQGASRLRAPDGLVDRIVAAVEAEAAVAAPAPAEPHTVPVLGIPSAPHRARRLAAWWQPRFALYATAAAAVVFLGLSSLLVARMGMQTASVEDQVPRVLDLAASSPESAESYAGGSDPAAADTEALRTQVAAPPYVTYEGRVWALVGPAVPEPSTLATIGVVVSDLGTTAIPAQRAVLGTPGDTGIIHLRFPDGTLQRFAPVTRSLGLADYALVTNAPITVFGVWPSLPERFAPPTSPDGAPTFTRRGFDDRNVDAYLPVGGSLTDGFAIAPDMPADDPSAGNPNWTWWERIE